MNIYHFYFSVGNGEFCFSVVLQRSVVDKKSTVWYKTYIHSVLGYSHFSSLKPTFVSLSFHQLLVVITLVVGLQTIPKKVVFLYCIEQISFFVLFYSIGITQMSTSF